MKIRKIKKKGIFIMVEKLINPVVIYKIAEFYKGYCEGESRRKENIITKILSDLDTAEERYNAIECFYQNRGEEFPDIVGMKRDYVKNKLEKIGIFRDEIKKRFYSKKVHPILDKMDINPTIMVEDIELLREISGVIAVLRKDAVEDYYTLNLILK